MINNFKKITLASVVSAAIIFTQCGPGGNKGGGGGNGKMITTPFSSVQLPTDEDTSGLAFNKAGFQTWFAGASITQNGLVVPANSANFQATSNMNFFKWSMQMFSWLTSSTAGGALQTGKFVFNSPVFFTVSPADASGNRSITPNGGQYMLATSHISQKFGNGAILVRTKKGALVRFLPSKNKANEAVRVMDDKGEIVEVGKITKNAAGTHTLMDVAGKEIAHFHPVNIPKNAVTDITKDGITIVVNSFGEEEELAQAGSANALMAQNKSLIYYISMINDVYADFVMAVKAGYSSAVFPTSLAEVNNICSTIGAPLPGDASALAMELKTSWVEVDDSFAFPGSLTNYVTINAQIPAYKAGVINGINCIYPVGQRPAVLALIGMHIVGSVQGHPEMVWASLEHRSNDADSCFLYVQSNSAIKATSIDAGNNWLLSNSTSGAQNVQNMTVGSGPNQGNGDTIYATPPSTTISASNTLRTCPFGNSLIPVSNHADSVAKAGLNSQVIALNNFLGANFATGDVRANYMLLGAEWTFDGAAPNGNITGFPNDTIFATGSAIGTATLNNSTMETTFQNYMSMPAHASFILTCFGCHSSPNLPNSTPSLKPDSISHIFSNILQAIQVSKTSGKAK